MGNTLAMLAILVPASVTVVGYWFKQQADNEQGGHPDRDPRKTIEGRHDAGRRTVTLHQREHENDCSLSAEITDSTGAALDEGEKPGTRRERDEPRQKLGQRNGEEGKRGDPPNKAA